MVGLGWLQRRLVIPKRVHRIFKLLFFFFFFVIGLFAGCFLGDQVSSNIFKVSNACLADHLIFIGAFAKKKKKSDNLLFS